MKGSQVKQVYKNVPDSEWLEIQFIKALALNPKIIEASRKLSHIKMTPVQFAAEIFLGVLSSKKKTLKTALEYANVFAAAGLIDKTINWSNSVQGHRFWDEIHDILY